MSNGRELNFLQKLHILQIRGCLKKHNFSSNVKLFHKLPHRLVFPLRDLVGESILHAGHVFLGFTRDGHFLLSYTVQVEVDVNTSAPCYIYQLHWWHFMPYRPLKKMSEVRLFGENEINQDLRIVVCQWPMDEENILIYGCCTSSVQDAVQCYLTITAQPSLQQCSDCMTLKDKQIRDESLCSEGSHTIRCLKHCFTIHTNFILVPPYPSFSPSICMKKDKMVLINTGDNIVSLSISVETQTVLSSATHSHHSFDLNMPNNSSCNLDKIRKNIISNKNETCSDIQRKNIDDKLVCPEIDCNRISKNKKSNHIENSLHCCLTENYLECTNSISPSERKSNHQFIVKNDVACDMKQISEDGIFFSNHLKTTNTEHSIFLHDKFSGNIYQNEENQTYSQNCRQLNIKDNYNCINQDSDQDSSSMLSVTNCGKLQNLPSLSSNDKMKRTVIDDCEKISVEKRRKSTDIKYSNDMTVSRSSLYCGETDLIKQTGEHRCNDKSDFLKVNHSFPLKNVDEAIKENISPDPNKNCACELYKFSLENSCEVLPKNRTDFAFCTSHNCSITNNIKLSQMFFTKKCVSEAVHHFMQDDDLNRNNARDDADDVWNNVYPTILSLEVHGTAYKPLKMISKTNLQGWQGQSVIIHQLIFDIELYIHEMGQKICTAAGVKYLAFSDYDVQIIDLCPVSSIAVILVLMLIQAKVEKKEGEDGLNLGRHMYQTGFKFEWNISSGIYSVMDTDELKEIDPHPKMQKRWNEIWNPAQQAVKRLQKTWLLSPSTLHSVNILTNEAVFQGKSLKVLWPATHHVAVVL